MTPAERAALQAATLASEVAKLRALIDDGAAEIDVSDFSVAAIEAATAYAKERGKAAATAIVKRRVMLGVA